MASEYDAPHTIAPPATAPSPRLVGRRPPARRTSSYDLLTIAAVGLLILAVVYTLYFAKIVFFPLALALVLRVLLHPPVSRLASWGVPRGLGAAMVVLAAVGLTVLVAALVAAPASQWIKNAPEHLSEAKQKLKSLKKPLEEIGEATDSVGELANVQRPAIAVPVRVQYSPSENGFWTGTMQVLLVALLTFVLLYFLLAGEEGFLDKLPLLYPSWRDDNRLSQLREAIAGAVSRYLATVTLINVGLGCVIGTGMWLIGLPNPVLWGVMAAVLNFVPYLGCLVGCCVVSITALITFDSPFTAIWAPAIYLGTNGVEAYLITPIMLGRSIRLSPLAIVLSLSVWGFVWGVGGLLLSVPILVVTKITCDHIERLAPLGKLLGGERSDLTS